MQLTTMIVLSEAGYRVTVVCIQGNTRAWSKTYLSKRLCLEELKDFDLITPLEAEEAICSDFGRTKSRMIFHTNSDEGTLLEAGFLEQFDVRIN